MGDAIIHRLDLVIHLIDTTTGNSVDTRDVNFIFESIDLPRPLNKGGGEHILIDSGRNDFKMTVEADGYERAEVSVEYDRLSDIWPMQEVFLIPSEKTLGMENYREIKGTLEGLSELAFILTDNCLAHFDSYSARKNVVKLFEKGHRLNMTGSPYGLVTNGGQSFLRMDVKAQPAQDQVLLKEPLEGELTRNSAICRMIFGRVDSEGNYLMRIRMTGNYTRGIAGYIVDGELRFMEIDFMNPEGLR